MVSFIKFLISLIIIFFIVETFLTSKKMSKAIIFSISVAVVVFAIFSSVTFINFNDFNFKVDSNSFENESKECEYIESFLTNKLVDDGVVEVDSVKVSLNNNEYMVKIYIKDSSEEKKQYVIQTVQGIMNTKVEVYEK